MKKIKSFARPRSDQPRIVRSKDNYKDRYGDEDQPRVETKAESKIKREQLAATFETLWKSLFNSQVHLDSALSKQTKRMKSVLAQIVPAILLRPASQAEALGVGVPLGEPFSLQAPQQARWRPATVMAERLYSMMTTSLPTVHPFAEDFPQTWVAKWKENYGEHVAKELINTLGREAPLSLRAVRKVGSAKLLKELTAGSALPVKAVKSDFAPLGVRLAGYAPVLQTDLFKSGAFEIQDEGSQIMALFALWPKIFAPLLKKVPGAVVPKLFEIPNETPAWTVIDACAGAGGKSLAMGDALQGRGRIFAYDTSSGKLLSLKRRAKNAGLNNIKTTVLKEGDEKSTIAQFRARADVVLVDAPCSGWGVLRRNPDIKWRQTQEVLDRMAVIQARLLDIYSQLVAPGGRLIFGVCTFRPEETTAIVEDFVEKHPEFTRGEGGFFGPGPCDGFYMQAFYKKAKSAAKG